MADDDSAKLYRGERNRVWLKLGQGDPAGPYEIAFINAASGVATPWATATAAEHPDGGDGIYVWASNGEAPGTAAPGTIPLTRGHYRTRPRHADGYLVNVEELGILEVE